MTVRFDVRPTDPTLANEWDKKRRANARGMIELQEMCWAAFPVVDAVDNGRIKRSGHHVSAFGLAGMACGRTAEGQKEAVQIRPWVMKAVAAAGLPVDRSYIICRDLVDGVEELRAFADEGFALLKEHRKEQHREERAG